jgi:[ribosomal protein S5]-alanine N-acetyltransferase
MIITAPILTERLVLRSLTESDVTPKYLHWLLDEEITRFLEVRFAPEQTLETLEQFVIAANDSSDALLLGIFTKDGSRHIGNIKLGPICRNHSRADLGFLIGEREAWGKGFATEAIVATSHYALTTLRLGKLTAGCYASNQGSARALEKAGFSQEARLPKHQISGGVREDVLLFGKLSLAT